MQEKDDGEQDPFMGNEKDVDENETNYPEDIQVVSTYCPRASTYFVIVVAVFIQGGGGGGGGGRLFPSVPPFVRHLFEDGVYSRVASIRGNTVYSLHNQHEV